MFAVIGILCSRNNIPLAPIIMGFTLGGTVEVYFRKAMIAYDGSFVAAYTGSPIGSVFVTIAILVPIIVIFKRMKAAKKTAAVD